MFLIKEFIEKQIPNPLNLELNVNNVNIFIQGTNQFQMALGQG